MEDGLTTATNIGGKECRLLASRPRARCYFQILPTFKRPRAVNARIQVEYYAASTGVMQIQFDGTSRLVPHYTNGGKKDLDGEPTWKIAYFQLNDALFRNGEGGGADFRLTTWSRDLYIHSVTVSFD